MKRTTTIVLAVSIALSMTACEQLDSLLQINVFEPFAGVSDNAITEATAVELIDLAGSTSFYEALAEDEDGELKVAVLATIDAELLDATAEEKATPEYQELAVLGAQIELQTTPAGELINNIGGLIDSLISGSGEEPVGDEDYLGLLIQDIIPDSVLTFEGEEPVIDEVAFIDMINGLVDANDYYEQLGEAIGTDGYADDVDFSAGDVAQSALVAALVAGVTVPAGYETVYPTPGDYLYALASEDPAAPAAEFVMPDMDIGALANLLAAANLSFDDTTTL